MSHHKHCHCDHDLKYCSHCDVVYCTKCGKEWGQKHYCYPWTYPYYPWTYTATAGGVATGDTVTISGHQCNCA